MAVNDWYQITVDSTVKGEHVYNVFNFRETVECSDDVPAMTLVEAFHAAITAAWVALLSEQTTINCYTGRRRHPTPSVNYTKIVNEPGEEVGDAIPTTSALLVSWYGLIASPRHRGRTYFTGMPETVQAGGLLVDAAITDWGTFANLMMEPIVAGTTGTWELGIWSDASIAGVDAKIKVVRSNLASMLSRRQRPGAA